MFEGESSVQSTIQLGGCNATEMAASVEKAWAIGWRRFNINCGCPAKSAVNLKPTSLPAGLMSRKFMPEDVSYGALLMRSPERVREIGRQMLDRASGLYRAERGMSNDTALPVDLVSIKCRIGVDELEGADYLSQFIRICAESGIRYFILHSRKALLVAASSSSFPPDHLPSRG